MTALIFATWLPQQRLGLNDPGLLARHLYAIGQDVPDDVAALSDLVVFLRDLAVADEIQALAIPVWRAYERDRSRPGATP